MDKIRNILGTIKNIVENYPAGYQKHTWDLEELDGDLDEIYHCVEEIEDLIRATPQETDTEIAKRKFLEWWRGFDKVSEIVHNIVKVSYLEWLDQQGE